MMNKIDETLCEAIDLIVNKRLEGITFDKTILCTITDNSEREKNKYLVSDGSVSFFAFTTMENTMYSIGTNVYVQIPNGDWNQQKIIVGKKISDENNLQYFKNPFDTLIDLTDNKITINNARSGKMVANSENNEGILTLWTYNKEDSPYNQKGEEIKGFKRLGLKADFQSWLNSFVTTDENGKTYRSQVIQGNYGLRLIITGAEADVAHSTDETKEFTYIATLEVADMNGNPYNFFTNFEQEKVFNISEIPVIKNMELQFFQEPGSFKDYQGVPIPHLEGFGNEILPNLLVDNIYLSFGYDLSEIKDETVEIVSNSKTFDDEEEIKHKEVMLRWIHKMPDGSFKLIEESDLGLNYQVNWYKYDLGASSADAYSGVHWKLLTKQILKNGEWTYEKADEIAAFEPSFMKTYFIPNTQNPTEKIKAIIIYNDTQVIRSEIFTFTNNKKIVDNTTLEAATGLSINCEDGSHGNYYTYDTSNTALSATLGNTQRNFKPYFKKDGKLTEFVEGDSIEWLIPKTNTMIVLENSFLSVEGSDDYKILEDYIDIDEEEYYHIIRYGKNGSLKPEGKDYTLQPYRVKSYYSPSASNNTIRCIIKKGDVTYTALKTLNFGTSGNTGSDMTLVLDIDEDKNALTVLEDNSEGNDIINITARLYDYENREISLAGEELEWSWKNPLPLKSLRYDDIILPCCHSLGDINKDGKIDEEDINLLSSYLNKTITFDDEQKWAANVNLSIGQEINQDDLDALKRLANQDLTYLALAENNTDWQIIDKQGYCYDYTLINTALLGLDEYEIEIVHSNDYCKKTLLNVEFETRKDLDGKIFEEHIKIYTNCCPIYNTRCRCEFNTEIKKAYITIEGIMETSEIIIPAARTLGDVTGDGKIDMNDIIAMRKYLNKTSYFDFTNEQMKEYFIFAGQLKARGQDWAQDNKFTLEDIQLLLNLLRKDFNIKSYEKELVSDYIKSSGDGWSANKFGEYVYTKKLDNNDKKIPKDIEFKVDASKFSGSFNKAEIKDDTLYLTVPVGYPGEIKCKVEYKAIEGLGLITLESIFDEKGNPVFTYNPIEVDSFVAYEENTFKSQIPWNQGAGDFNGDGTLFYENETEEELISDINLITSLREDEDENKFKEVLKTGRNLQALNFDGVKDFTADTAIANIDNIMSKVQDFSTYFKYLYLGFNEEEIASMMEIDSQSLPSYTPILYRDHEYWTVDKENHIYKYKISLENFAATLDENVLIHTSFFRLNSINNETNDLILTYNKLLENFRKNIKNVSVTIEEVEKKEKAFLIIDTYCPPTINIPISIKYDSSYDIVDLYFDLPFKTSGMTEVEKTISANESQGDFNKNGRFDEEDKNKLIEIYNKYNYYYDKTKVEDDIGILDINDYNNFWEDVNNNKSFTAFIQEFSLDINNDIIVENLDNFVDTNKDALKTFFSLEDKLKEEIIKRYKLIRESDDAVNSLLKKDYDRWLELKTAYEELEVDSSDRGRQQFLNILSTYDIVGATSNTNVINMEDIKYLTDMIANNKYTPTTTDDNENTYISSLKLGKNNRWGISEKGYYFTINLPDLTETSSVIITPLLEKEVENDNGETEIIVQDFSLLDTFVGAVVKSDSLILYTTCCPTEDIKCKIQYYDNGLASGCYFSMGKEGQLLQEAGFKDSVYSGDIFIRRIEQDNVGNLNSEFIDFEDYLADVDISNKDVKGSNEIRLIENEFNKEKISLQLYHNEVPKENYNILQASLNYNDKENKRHQLIAYLPIPIKLEKIDYIDGATSVIYNSSGSLENYEKIPYTFHFKNEDGEFKASYGSWEVNGQEAQEYLPKLKSAKTSQNTESSYNPVQLQPINTFVKDANEYVCVTGYIDEELTPAWAQPILVIQNRYGSKMFNEWDGELVVDEKNNSIRSAQIAAGKKESDNSYTGIIVGEYGKGAASEQDSEAKTGVYGFHKGEPTFGFLNDGTAFIGKAGSGRIEFDGNKATIKSHNWNDEEHLGMMLDLDDGFIHMRNPNQFDWETYEDDQAIKNTAIPGELYVKIDAHSNDYPLDINKNFRVDWAGNLEAHNASISGHINATSGTIGDCTINDEGKLVVNGQSLTNVAANTLQGKITFVEPLESGKNPPSGQVVAKGTLVISNDPTQGVELKGLNIQNIPGFTTEVLSNNITMSDIKIDGQSINLTNYLNDLYELSSDRINIKQEGKDDSTLSKYITQLEEIISKLNERVEKLEGTIGAFEQRIKVLEDSNSEPPVQV